MKGSLRLVLIVVCLSFIPALAAASATAPEVAITSPEEGLTLASQVVVVEAAYSAPEEAVIKLVELVIDGVTVDARELDPGEARGRVSFTWVAREYADGKHIICVRAIDSDGQVADHEISAWLESGQLGLDRGVRIASPSDGETVSGKTTIQVEVDDPKLARYVIFLVDDVFKALSNVRPFSYVWDTTRYLNGRHSLKAKASLGGEWEAVSPVVGVHVENPSGATAMRAPKVTAEAVAPSPMLPPARAGEQTLPAPMRTESPTPAPPPVVLDKPEVAVPGTAPFVSPSGELITPPVPTMVEPVIERAPMEIAALPTFGESAGAGEPMLTGPAHAADSSALAAESIGSAAVAAREPTPAPLEVALLGTGSAEAAVTGEPIVTADVWTPAPAGPAESMAMGRQEPASAPLEVALLDMPGAAPVGLVPAVVVAAPAAVEAAPAAVEAAPAAVEAAPAVVVAAAAVVVAAPAAVEAAPAPDAQVVEALPPIASEIRIAMLPPRPVERKPAPRVAAEPAPSEVMYVVESGDWLARIAAEMGVPARDIARANNLSDPSVLQPGQTLRIPSTPLYFDGRAVAGEAPTVIADGRAIVPFRAVIEEAGGTVTWDRAARRARAAARNHEISVVIGSDMGTVNGTKFPMGTPAAIRCDRTVVPLRFLGDALDMVLQYEEGVIHIASGL